MTARTYHTGGFTNTGNPYQTSILDAKPATLAAQSARVGQQGAEAQWNATQAANAAGSPVDDWQKQQRDQITALTEGRSNELKNDPRMNQAMDFFGGVLNGSNLPFSEQTQRAQLNQQANGTAAANAAQLRALEEAIVARGGSLQDPSFQAQKQEMMSNRQGQNLDALGKMLSEAGIANFNAQAQGANSLAGIRSGQNAQINSMNLAGAGFRAQDFRDTPTGGGSSYSFTGAPIGGPVPQAPVYNQSYSPAAPAAPGRLPGLAGTGNPSPYTGQPPYTLQTGNTWGGQPYGGAPSGPTAPRPSTGTGYVAGPGLSMTNQVQGPPSPAYQPLPVAPKPAAFGSPFFSPLGPGQF